MDTILSARAEVGAKTNRLEAAQGRQNLLQVNLEDLRSKIRGHRYRGGYQQVLDSGDGLQGLAAKSGEGDPAEPAGLPPMTTTQGRPPTARQRWVRRAR